MFVLPLARGHALARHHAVDRMFDESLERFFGNARPSAAVRTPAMDVRESDDAYTIAFDVPGALREQLEVSVEGRRVTLKTIAKSGIEAETAEPGAAPADAVAKPADRVLYRERTAATYARTVSLPAEVDEVASQAKFEDGVLTLTLTKKVKTGATRLSIG